MLFLNVQWDSIPYLANSIVSRCWL